MLDSKYFFFLLGMRPAMVSVLIVRGRTQFLCSKIACFCILITAGSFICQCRILVREITPGQTFLFVLQEHGSVA